MKEKSEYKSLAEWRKFNPKDYGVAKYNGWLDDICNTFGWERKKIKPAGYWTKERCIEEAKKYETKAEWERGNSSSHTSARKSNWFNECCLHMIKPKAAGYWTKELCIEEAKKYKTRTEWAQKSVGSYRNVMRSNKKWLGECTKHMNKKKPS
jgi:hypothetical protein